MNVEVAGDDEFRCGCSKGEKTTEVIKEDNGGR